MKKAYFVLLFLIMGLFACESETAATASTSTENKTAATETPAAQTSSNAAVVGKWKLTNYEMGEQNKFPKEVLDEIKELSSSMRVEFYDSDRYETKAKDYEVAGKYRITGKTMTQTDDRDENSLVIYDILEMEKNKLVLKDRKGDFVMTFERQ